MFIKLSFQEADCQQREVEHVLFCTKIESNCLNSEKNEPNYIDLFSEDSSKQTSTKFVHIGDRLEKI